MGHNTTIIIFNDNMQELQNDPHAGQRIARAISRKCCSDEPVSIDGICGTYGAVIETHHADGTALVAVGGNTGRDLGVFHPYGDEDEDEDVRLLKALADRLGYQVRRKPTPQTTL